jgi:hypothetical protein
MTSATAPRLTIHVPVPDEGHFPADGFLSAPELDTLLERLAQEYPDVFGALEMVTVRCMWKQKGGTSHGRAKTGWTVKQTGLNRHFADCDFVLWLAADHVRDLGLNVRSLLFHEAQHCGYEEGEDGAEGKPVYVGHDAELFAADITRLERSDWLDFVGEAAAAFEQIGLFGSEP